MTDALSMIRLPDATTRSRCAAKAPLMTLVMLVSIALPMLLHATCADTSGSELRAPSGELEGAAPPLRRDTTRGRASAVAFSAGRA
jgi:hypothetical protein